MKDIKIRQLLQLILAIGITVLIARVFFIDNFVVKGDSMSPTILDGDWVFVNKLSRHFSNFNRGNIIVVKPRTEKVKIIKRVIGLPGERIEIADGQVKIKNSRQDTGNILSESYLNLPASPSLGGPATPAIGLTTIQLDPKEYFILGDNRYISIDSRELGPIDEWNADGRVFFVFSLKTFSFKVFP